MFLFRKTIDIVERAAEVVVPRIRPRDDQLKEQWALILAWYRDRGFQWVLASEPSAQHGMSTSMSATIRPGQLPSPSTSPVDLAQTVTAATMSRARTRSPSASYRAGQFPRGDTESDDQLYSGAIPTLAESGVGTALANILRLVEEELHTASSRISRSASPTSSPAMSSSTFAFLDRDRDRHAELRGLYGVPRSGSNQSPYYSPTSPTFAQRTNSSLISPGSSQSSLAEQDIGPCLEFTLNNNFLVNLADMGSQDIPIGMTNEVVRFFTVFVTYVEQLNKGSLLPERSVRVPLGHLLTSVHGMIAALRAVASTQLDAQRSELESDWLNLVTVVFRSLSRVPINVELLLEPISRDEGDNDDDEDMVYDFPLLMQLLDVATRPASTKVGELAKALLLGAAEWLVLDAPVQDALATGGFAHTLVDALVDCPALDSMVWFNVINRFLLPFPRSSPVISTVADALETLFQARRVLVPVREEEENDDGSTMINTHVLVPPRLAPSLIPRLIAATIDLHPRLRIALLTCMPTTLLSPSAPSPSPTIANGPTNNDEWTALTTLDLYADLLTAGDAHITLPPTSTPCPTPPATLAARLIHTGLDLLHARLRKTADPAAAVADTAIAILSDVHAAYLTRPRVVDAPAVTIVAADVADLWHAMQLPEPVVAKRDGSSDSLDLGSPWRAGIVLALTTVLREMALARDEGVAWWVFRKAGVLDKDVLARIPFGDRRVAAEFHLEMGLILLMRLAYARYGPGSVAQAEVVRMWRVLCEDADKPD
ncbi:hypothetical protein GGF31_004067 [Allomyces arbusculus]|nr:hypothetical protein GGF31_004067 [Allomyces arbusculus]